MGHYTGHPHDLPVSEPRPSVGRIVLYREGDGTGQYVALITEVGPSGVYLTVFPPRERPYPTPGPVVQCPAGEAFVPGTWCWPARV